MGEITSRRHDQVGRVLDSNSAYLVAVSVLMTLLISFYAVLLVNMNAIDTKTEDLKQHPYAVTVAAGRAETLLMQVRTLDDRLAFAHTPETVASVKSEFASIDKDLLNAIQVIEQRHLGDSGETEALARCYEEFRMRQEQLIGLSLSDVGDEEIASFLATDIDPRINEMLDLDSKIIDAASRSFDQLYDTVNETRWDAIFTATVLMAAVMVSLVLFFVAIRRKNRKEERLQESLRRAVDTAQEASEAKSRFLSNVSHDIRTPLTAIMGLTDIALEHVSDEERVVESLQKMQLSSHHLLNLVNDVLDMSKIESGQIDLASKPFDLRALVETLGSIVRPQADTKQLDFMVTRVDVENGLVLGDEMRLSQVLINLLGNAVKYTEPGGVVRFSVAEFTPEEGMEIGVKLEAWEGQAEPVLLGEQPLFVRFAVEDTGIGMSQEFASHVFEPFEREDVPMRLQVEGTGLGMPIAKNLVDLMGGTITVQSERGHGSCFTLVLPFERYDGGEDEGQLEELLADECQTAADDLGQDAWAHVRALLAEDNEIIGEIAAEMIASTGATVERAWNGLEVLDLLEGEPEDRFDLILMDIQMPGMDGLEAARSIVERYAKAGRKRPPIIAITANAYEEDRQRAFDAGMDGFAVKPIGRKEVCHLFRAFVGSRSDD